MKQEQATFAGGCFWCTEAIFKELRGVQSVTSGYTGGQVQNPTYEQVSNGRTGHAEAIQIEFDPDIISYQQLVEVFFTTHDPTTPNRQGQDRGEQYRSVIFYHSDDQWQIAEAVKQRFEHERVYANQIITDIKSATDFYPAANYHQNYYQLNADKPYCQLVINPKLAKLRQKFAKIIKS